MGGVHLIKYWVGFQSNTALSSALSVLKPNPMVYHQKMPADLILNGPTSKRGIGTHHQTFIVAEIGQNHQGDINIARELIAEAKRAGADCVKFQKTSLTERFTSDALARPYKSINSFGETYGEHRQHLELTDDDFLTLQQLAISNNIMFTASAMDTESLNKMAAMGVPYIKIGSGDANNFPLIKKAAILNIPLMISTGMQTFDTVRNIYNIISEQHKNFVLMHCVSAYPTPPTDANLNLIHVYREEFPDIHIGYSGHELGCIAHFAVAAGARVVERHFTLNKMMKGSDHACSLNPVDFKNMVNRIREVEVIMGLRHKGILCSELVCRNKLGKSLVAACDLQEGHVLREEDIGVKVSHPPGIPGEHIRKLIGVKITKAYLKDDIFESNVLCSDVQ